MDSAVEGVLEIRKKPVDDTDWLSQAGGGGEQLSIRLQVVLAEIQRLDQPHEVPDTRRLPRRVDRVAQAEPRGSG